MRRLIACLLVCFSASVCAQSIQVKPQQCVWRGGDDVAWAAPGLDDSGWTLLTKTTLPDAAHLWIRCHVPLDRLRGVEKPSITVHLVSAYELFFQGVREGGNGNLRSGYFSADRTRIYPIALSGGSAPGIIALRITYRAYAAHGGDPVVLKLGSEQELRGEKAQKILDAVKPDLGYVTLYGIVGVVGVIGLGLFWYDRSRQPLLWLSLYCVFFAMMRVNTLATAAQVDYSSLIVLLVTLIGQFSFIFQLAFFFSVARKRVPWWIWVAYVISSVMDGVLVLQGLGSPSLSHRLGHFYPSTLLMSMAASTLLTLAPFVAFWPWNRIPGRLRPIAFCCFLWGLSDFVYFAYQLVVNDWLNQHARYIQHVAILFDMRALLSGVTVLVILALLFREQRRITEERAALAGEMQAAREIQRILAPDELACAPGLSVRVAFRPVREVGGDFYLCRVLGDGRQRILLGDVSGKGTAAAMTAALLLGGAEDHDALAPGELLSHLSRVLSESRVGGFATCVCADFYDSGKVTLANAGHLPPYCGGEELATVSALPLGVGRMDGGYEESSFALEPGDTLTFLSDGVVEARSSTGELFGFDRACAISDRSAEEIAGAAQEFGQEDDITVLTLTFAPAEVLHA